MDGWKMESEEETKARRRPISGPWPQPPPPPRHGRSRAGSRSGEGDNVLTPPGLVLRGVRYSFESFTLRPSPLWLTILN